MQMRGGATPALRRAGTNGGGKLRWWMYLLLFAAAVGVYFNSLKNGFSLDDVAIVQVNEHVTGLHWAEIWGDNYWPKQDGVAPDVLYRPLTIWTYLANEAVAPGEAWGFHLTNVILHGVATVLVAALAWRVFGKRGVAVLTGGLFALHPIHTEAVANTVGRAEVLAAIWSLLMLLVYLPTGPLMGGERFERRGWWHGLLVAVCFFAAMLCKETPVTLLVAVVFVDLWRWANGGREGRPVLWRWMGRQMVRYYLPLWAAFGVYLAMRVNACGLMQAAAHTHPIVNPLVTASLWERVVTPFGLFAKYMELTAWPRVLLADYSAPSLMPMSNLLSSLPLLGLSLAALLAVIAAKSWKTRPAVVLAIGLFVCAYGLVANVLRIGTIFGERLFYWPSVFVLMLAAFFTLEAYAALLATGARRLVRPAAAVLLLTVFGGMSYRTMVRNTDWESNVSLSIASARDNLKSSKACYWAGITLVNQGPQPWMEEFGASLLERATKLYPEYGECYWELAKYQGRHHEFVKSVELLAKAAEYRPGCGYIRAGVEAVRQEMAGRPSDSYLPAIDAYAKEHPAEGSAQFALALAYDAQRDYASAEEACQRAFALNHTFHEAAYEMAQVRHANGDYEKAVDILRQYVINVRFSPDVRCLLARYLLDLDEAKNPHAVAEATMNLDKAASLEGLSAVRELRMEISRRQRDQASRPPADNPMRAMASRGGPS
jgi:tetratricopeptide (TPR) repeat protein